MVDSDTVCTLNTRFHFIGTWYLVDTDTVSQCVHCLQDFVLCGHRYCVNTEHSFLCYWNMVSCGHRYSTVCTLYTRFHVTGLDTVSFGHIYSMYVHRSLDFTLLEHDIWWTQIQCVHCTLSTRFCVM